MPRDKDWKAIYGTDLSIPPSEAVAAVRAKLANCRGQLFDIYTAHGWKDRIDHVEGLLTCGIIALYNTVEEMRKSEQAETLATKAKEEE